MREFFNFPSTSFKKKQSILTQKNKKFMNKVVELRFFEKMSSAILCDKVDFAKRKSRKFCKISEVSVKKCFESLRFQDIK